MTIDNNLWVFGYGSLCWNPGFDYGDQVIGHIRGFARKFWQGNTTHRGTDEKVRDSWQLSSLSSKASQEMIERFCFIVSGQPSLLQLVSNVYSHSFVGFVSLSQASTCNLLADRGGTSPLLKALYTGRTFEPEPRLGPLYWGVLAWSVECRRPLATRGRLSQSRNKHDFLV